MLFPVAFPLMMVAFKHVHAAKCSRSNRLRDKTRVHTDTNTHTDASKKDTVSNQLNANPELRLACFIPCESKAEGRKSRHQAVALRLRLYELGSHEPASVPRPSTVRHTPLDHKPQGPCEPLRKDLFAEQPASQAISAPRARGAPQRALPEQP